MHSLVDRGENFWNLFDISIDMMVIAKIDNNPQSLF